MIKTTILKVLCNKVCTKYQIDQVKSHTTSYEVFDIDSLYNSLWLIDYHRWSSIFAPLQIRLILKAYADEDWLGKPDWARL